MKRKKSYPTNKYLARITWWKKHLRLLFAALTLSFSFFPTRIPVVAATNSTTDSFAISTTCPENQPYDPESRECRPKKNHLKPCPAGKIRNPATKRCIKENPPKPSELKVPIEPKNPNLPEQGSNIENRENEDDSTPESNPENIITDEEGQESSDLTSDSTQPEPEKPKFSQETDNNSNKPLKTCPTGQELNPLTNRCKKIPVPNTSAKSQKACPVGQELNPLTNRCKKSTTALASEAKTCDAGYELNSKTNRCIKIKKPKINDGATHPLLVQKKDTSKKVFIAGVAILSIIIISLSYLIFQFRKEIARTFKKLKNKFSRAQPID